MVTKAERRLILSCLMAVTLFCGVAAAQAPKLAEMVPANGETNVDPSLTTIRFVFDQDMITGQHYSICGGGEDFPKGKSKPQWVSSRVLEWPVELEPSHEYQFSLNCPSSHKGFMNKESVSADYTPLSFTTGAKTEQASAQADTASLAALFQQAVYAEKTEGNLEKAIGLYEQIIDQAADVERVAARALLQLAGCYEKKGDTAAAAGYYQKIVDDCPSQTAAVSKAVERLAAIRPQNAAAINILPEAVWNYIGNGFVANYMEAQQKGLAANVHVYGVTEDMQLTGGGILMYRNDTTSAITADMEVQAGRFSYNNLIIVNQHGKMLSSRMEVDPLESTKYRLFWKPDAPIAPGQMVGIGWQKPGAKSLIKNSDGGYSFDMQNFYGSKVLETFFLVLPSDLEIQKTSEPFYSSGKFGELTVYQWKKEVPENTNNKVTVKIGKFDLQSVIDSAKSGDTVTVKSGIYSTPIIITKPITLRGQSFQDCRFEVVSDQPAIQIKQIGASGSVNIENLTINWQLATSTGSKQNPVAIDILDSNVIINGCVIENTATKERAPAAIFTKGFSELKLTNSQIEGPFDYAVNFGEGTKGTVADCFISKPEHQGIMLYAGADVLVERNIITGSKFHAVRTTGGKLILRNNWIESNNNRGIYLGSQSGSGIIENNVINNNATGISGFSMSEFIIRNNIISNSSYAGIGFERSTRLMIENNIFARNQKAWTMLDRGGTNGNGCRKNTFWANRELTEGFSHTQDSIIEDKDHFISYAFDIDPNSQASIDKQGLTDTKILKTVFDRWDRSKSNSGIKRYIANCTADYHEQEPAAETSKEFVPDASYMRDNEFMKFSLTQRNGMKLGTLLWCTKLDDEKEHWQIQSFMTIEAGPSQMRQYTYVKAGVKTLKPANAITDNWSGQFEITYSDGSVNSKVTSAGKTIEKDIAVIGSVFDNEQAFYVIRSMPLAEGFDKSFMIYPPQSGVVSECRIKVEGIEKIKFDGKETDCFKTKLICAAAGQTFLEHTLWITTDPLHWVVKYDSGAAVMELTEYGIKDFGDDKEKIFETMKPAAAVTQTMQIDMNKKATTEEKMQAENFRAAGWRLFMQGKPAEAEGEFKKALALDPQMENSWQGLGWAQRNQAKNLNAKDSFEKCLAINPKNSAALNGMGQITKAEGDTDKAEEYWKRGVAADAAATGPMMGLAQLYEEKQEYREAAKYYKVWLKAEPSNQTAKDGADRMMEKLKQ